MNKRVPPPRLLPPRVLPRSAPPGTPDPTQPSSDIPGIPPAGTIEGVYPLNLTPISQLPQGGQLVGPEWVPVVQGGITVKVTPNDFVALGALPMPLPINLGGTGSTSLPTSGLLTGGPTAIGDIPFPTQTSVLVGTIAPFWSAMGDPGTFLQSQGPLSAPVWSAGPIGPQGPQGPRGSMGPQGPTGPQGAPGQSAVIVGSFTNQPTSALPPSGIIPANWDAPGSPPAQVTMGLGQALVDLRTQHVWVYVGTSINATGWLDLGANQGPQGPAGTPGAQGPQGAQGPAGAAGATGPQGPQAGKARAINSITPDGTTTVFTLTALDGTTVNVTANAQLLISLDGVIMEQAVAYTATGAALTFVTAPAADAHIFIVWFDASGAAGAGGIAEAPNDAYLYGRHALGWTSGGTFSGNVVMGSSLSANNGLQITAPQYVVNALSASGATIINWALGEVQAVSLAANATISSIAGWPASGQWAKLVLQITNQGAFNITGWPAGTIWPGGTAPTITSGSGKRDVIILMSGDGGATFWGSVAGQDYR